MTMFPFQSLGSLAISVRSGIHSTVTELFIELFFFGRFIKYHVKYQVLFTKRFYGCILHTPFFKLRASLWFYRAKYFTSNPG